MTNIESDHYYLYDDEAVVIYHNPDSTCGGTFMEHHFPYRRIAELIKKNGTLTDEDVMEHLFGDAFHCPTCCIDIGTDGYEFLLSRDDDGIMPEHPGELLTQCAEFWQAKENAKRSEKNLIEMTKGGIFNVKK